MNRPFTERFVCGIMCSLLATCVGMESPSSFNVRESGTSEISRAGAAASSRFASVISPEQPGSDRAERPGASQVAVAPEGQAGGHDWPQWRGPHRDGHSSESGLLVHWPEQGPRVIWQVAGGDGFSSLSIVDRSAYTMLQRDDAQWVVCLDVETGRERWAKRSGPAYHESQGGDGPRATPVVDGNRLYTLDAVGNLLCLEKTSAETIWQHNILERFGAENLYWGVSISPLIEGDMLLLNVGGPGTGFVALNKHTGETVWKAHEEPASYSSPVAVTVGGVREVIFFAGRAIVGLSPRDGRVHWRHEWKTTDDMNIATPIWSDPYLFVSSGRGTGAGVFRLEGGDGTVAAEPVWTSQVMQNHFNSCVRVGEHVYGFDNAILKCVELKTGNAVWADRSVGKGSLLYADGHLFLVGEQGDIGVAEATPEGYREHGRMLLLQYKAWAAPALARGRLYVRDQKSIACVDLTR